MKKYSDEEVLKINAEYKKSNLSIEKFAEYIGIKKHTMAWIRTRAIRHFALQDNDKPRMSFTKVNAFSHQQVRAPEIRLEINNVSIFLNNDSDNNTLAEIIQVLKND